MSAGTQSNTGANAPPRIVGGRVVRGDEPRSTVQQTQSNAWEIVNAVGLFFRSLFNPAAVDEAVNSRNGQTGAFPNPFPQPTAPRNNNNLRPGGQERGRALGRRIRGLGDIQPVTQMGGCGSS